MKQNISEQHPVSLSTALQAFVFSGVWEKADAAHKHATQLSPLWLLASCG